MSYKDQKLIDYINFNFDYNKLLKKNLHFIDLNNYKLRKLEEMEKTNID